MGYSSKDLAPQTGRTFVITGANSGIGLEAALALAAAGARVVMACRDPGRAGEALSRVRAASPSAVVETLALDLASIASIRAAIASASAGAATGGAAGVTNPAPDLRPSRPAATACCKAGKTW